MLLAELSNECIEETGEVIRDRATEMKITAMNAPASLDEENQTEQTLTIT